MTQQSKALDVPAGPREQALSTSEIDRALEAALADLWADCYRRDQPLEARRAMFDAKVQRAVRAATGG